MCKDINNTAVGDCFYLYSGTICDMKSDELKSIHIIVRKSSIISILILILLVIFILLSDFVSFFIEHPKPKRTKVARDL